jgi:hypothetical protein
MAETTRSRFLPKMLERLYAAMTGGPSLHCRPQNSRQRIDLCALACLDGPQPQEAIGHLLGDAKAVKYAAPLSNRKLEEPPPTSKSDAPAVSPPVSEEKRAVRRQIEEQQAALRKLAVIADDAASYEHETGAQVLFLGYPLLSIPPRSSERGRGGATRRVLAPIAFIPVQLTVKKGRAASVEIASCAQGIDRVMPNQALLAWAEQQSGRKLRDQFADEEGAEPWREVNELTAAVCRALELPAPPPLGPQSALSPAPRADAEEAQEPRVLCSAVLGLFPLSNQSLVRDLEALAEGEKVSGPIESFLKVDASLAPAPPREPGPPSGARAVGEERLIAPADPCQARAVRLARTSHGLVIHGPPGTGKSQTITNAIGDHLSRGERVLLVCDKRTALDVVKYRLDALGLGELCAVVHDAQRDQKDLYLGIRNQLDALAETRSDGAAAAALSAADRELTSLHEELTAHDRALSERPSGTEPSFHELAGEWLSIDAAPALAAGSAELASSRLADVASRESEVREALSRGVSERYPDNPWRPALGIGLRDWLARPMEAHRQAIDRLVEAAQAADGAIASEIPPFAPGVDLAAQGEARAELGEALAAVVRSGQSEELARWGAQPKDSLEDARTELSALEPEVAALASGPLDPKLTALARSAPPSLPELLPWIARLDAYLRVARRWYGFLFLFRRLKAASVLARFGLALSVLAVERVARFLSGAKARALLSDYERRLLRAAPDLQALPDEELRARTEAQAAAFALLSRIDEGPALAPQAADLRRALASATGHARLAEGLRKSRSRADAILALLETLASAGLFSARYRADLDAFLREGHPCAALVLGLQERLSSVEGLLRIEAGVGSMPAPLAAALRKLLDAGAGPEPGWAALKKGAVAAELSRRIRENPTLQAFDAQKLAATHSRYRALEAKKRVLVREAILHRWIGKQRERLLASTGSRLNGAATEVRRRLMLRGERVLKVRQVIAAGVALEGGDPLFDLRPVWMASPDTVAQIFPRQPLFDVVIFDESSQCRLEEALPVLTRARRVVIAGDPKQLPPTRFFESAVSQSEASEPEGDQALFEEQQSEVEDLLGAALNLEIEQAYLDVHYRSQNADLIEFSNQRFYDARLQAIPGHPANRATSAPLRLIPVAGTYDERVNLREAQEVVAIVRQLLAQPQPPSIGVACFNLSQRDAVVDALDDAAASDQGFASLLATARARQGPASFEGLFVKNLENVQGDERDHMIISTTYGPDPKGRFYRRFGPLGTAGGGRRLNVLVTRARQEVHLVTSIPREVYTALAPLAAGQAPSGAWLLFSYLQWAETLEREYREEGERLSLARVSPQVETLERPSGAPSPFARALARRLAQSQGLSSDVHWGNDGFCVDVALHHPTQAENVTVGILCDGSRFARAPDRVEWDLFRTAMLEGQGWKLLRLWTPQFFRDPEAALESVLRASAEVLAKEAPSAQRPNGEARVLH